ncbi:MAG: chorismate synthase [Clostridia bacterium]|nr:chorismate synthase [Clostridia bacterium]
MSSIWGNNIQISLFGESHGKAIGAVIHGLPPGIALDFDAIDLEMKRRAPGKSPTSTPRKEKDAYEIVSGFFNGKTTGTPLCCFIANKDTRSKDYEKTALTIRPGHADYTGYIKYKGFNDYRGGGHFSGRLTAPLVFAGAIAKQILKQKNIAVGSHIYQIGSIKDTPFENPTAEMFQALSNKKICVLDDKAGNKMEKIVLEAKEQLDSLGGIIETAIINIPAGMGSPFFDSIESRLSSMMFSIPAVKGIEFGQGFNFAHMKGSEANDAYTIHESQIQTETNHNGGILGGISNGMPIVFRTVFKPTPSISQKQKTVNLKLNEAAELVIQGRHDPCIVFRAVAVTEAAAALVILDLLLEGE